MTVSFIFWIRWRQCEVCGAPRLCGSFFGSFAKRVIVTADCRRIATAVGATGYWKVDCGVSSCDTVTTGNFQYELSFGKAMVQSTKLHGVITHQIQIFKYCNRRYFVLMQTCWKWRWLSHRSDWATGWTTRHVQSGSAHGRWFFLSVQLRCPSRYAGVWNGDKTNKFL
jgi:hypothetical protein